jgi:hypothetical protein
VHEKRSHARARVSVPVTCELEDGTTFAGEGRDLSIGGMFVAAEHRLEFNTRIVVVASIGAAKPSRLPAVVRWSKSEGFGVQFGLLGAVETHLIAKIMRP